MFIDEINITIADLENLSRHYDIKNLPNAYEYTIVGIIYKDIEKQLEDILKCKIVQDETIYDISNIRFMYNMDDTYDFAYTFNKDINPIPKRKFNIIKNNILYNSTLKLYVSNNKVKMHINLKSLLLNRLQDFIYAKD